MSSSSGSLDVDVIIVGAGPVGMTMAALLASRDIKVHVLEARSGTSEEPKAISIDDEALRTYQQAGLEEEISGVIVPGTGTRYYDSNNEPIFQARGEFPFRLGYPFKNPFAQPDLERVLAENLEKNPLVTVEYNTKVIEVAESGPHAHVVADGPTGVRILKAVFVVGADGGRSVVREQIMDNAMSGRSYPQVWLVADTLEDPHTERYGMHHGDPARPHVIVPGLDGRCRYEFLLYDGEGTPEDSPSFELIKKLVAPYRDLEPQHIERAVNYRFNAVNADQYRSGRFFLIGDAAHMMPPFAGQGLNSGIRDAANLSWKLAEVLKGTAPQTLLDSYEVERKPHAKAIIDLSVRLGSVVMTTSERVASHRDQIVKEALLTNAGRAFFEEMQYRPRAKFDSALTLTSGAGTALAQPLAFDAQQRLSARMDYIVGPNWKIFGVDVPAKEWAGLDELANIFGARTWSVPFEDLQPRDIPSNGILIDLDGSLYREFEPYRGHFVLVRPDHFTAAVFTPELLPEIIDRATALHLAPATV